MSKKGTYHEYKLMEIFESFGYATLRTLGSGGGTKKSKPDVVVGNSRNIFGIEVKNRNGNVCYIKDSQVEELKDFCYTFGASPLIVVKFGRNPFYVFDVDSIKKCEKNYRINIGDLRRGIEIKKFISGLKS